MDDSSDEETYSCPCGRQFKRKATYERHMDIAHSSAESHKCRVCGKTFGNANTLKMHMNIHQDSKTDAKIERLTRGRKNRTPSGNRDKSDRSAERNPRMRSPNVKQDRSKSKDSAKQSGNKEEKPLSKQTIDGKVTDSIGINKVNDSNKMDNLSAPSISSFKSNKSVSIKSQDSEIKSCDTAIKSCDSIMDSSPSTTKSIKTDSLVLPSTANVSEPMSVENFPVIIKTEPPSPPACEEPVPTVSPSAKENMLPLTAALPSNNPETSDKLPAMKSILLQANEAPKVPMSLLVEKDKVRLVDSTNTSRLPLQDPKTGPSTIIIKIEDSEKHCQSSTNVPKTSAPALVGKVGHSSEVIVTSSAAANKVGQNGLLTQAPLFVHLPESLGPQSTDVKPVLDLEGLETDEEGMSVRKSTRLKGKTPGWRSWLEEDEEIQVQGKGIKRRRSSKVKLEGEDYEIIQQVVDMTSGSYPEPQSPELPTTLASPSDPTLQGLNKRCQREVTKTVFACPVCSKEFFSEKYLSMHMSLHRGSGSTEVPSPPGTEEEEPPVKKTKVNVNGAGAHWTCKICNKTFAQNSNFKNHIRTHSDERPFVCDICCIGFKERYHLKKHMLFKHSNELKEECRVCGKKFKDSTAVRAHERIHSDVRPYACRRCGKTFKTSECLWHHENRSKTCGVALDGIQAPSSRFRRGRQPRKSPEPSPVQVKTESVSELVIAQPTVAQPSLLQVIPATVDTIPTTVQALEASHKPPTTTATLQLLTAHKNLLQVSSLKPTIQHHHQPQPQQQQQQQLHPQQVLVKVQPESPSPIIRADPQLPVVKVEAENELPDYELAGLPSDSSMDDSSQDADLQDLFASDEDTDDLDSPMSFEGLGKDDDQLSPDFEQDEDGRIPTTVTGSDLMTMCCDALEIRADSQGKKRYLCTKCGKQFASPAAFEKHMVTHSEMRPYKCSICDIGFKLKVHLKKHNLYRHSNEYPCECSICGKKFKDSSAVRLHERIHSTDRPFKCECGKSFKTRENLWGHRHRGPCEKNKDLILQTKMHKGLLPNMPVDAHAKIGDTHISAHASILDNQIIAHAFVSNNKVTAKATIGDNGEVTASALIQGPKISAKASVNGNDGTAHATVGDQAVSAPIPATVVELQAKEEATIKQTHPTSSLPTAVVAPIKKVVPPVASPPAKVADKGLPPFETFAPTIMSALQKPPRLPPGVTLPHLAKQMTSNGPCQPHQQSGSIADKCPTIQKYLQQNRPTTTRLPGIQQLFQSHSLAHAIKNNNLPPSPIKSSTSTSPVAQLRPPATPPSALTRGTSSPFLDLNLPPPPPYPGNPNLGGPANADFRAKTPSSFDSHQSPLPLVCWDDDSGPDKKGVSVQWQTDADTLFHELANSTAFGQL